MNTWQDVFNVEHKKFAKRKGWFIIDKRNNSCYDKCYQTRTVACMVAARKFDRIIRELEKDLLG